VKVPVRCHYSVTAVNSDFILKCQRVAGYEVARVPRHPIGLARQGLGSTRRVDQVDRAPRGMRVRVSTLRRTALWSWSLAAVSSDIARSFLRIGEAI
jgi:hypothetical protein